MRQITEKKTMRDRLWNMKRKTQLVRTDKLEEMKNTCGKTKGYSKGAKTTEMNKQSKTGDKRGRTTAGRNTIKETFINIIHCHHCKIKLTVLFGTQLWNGNTQLMITETFFSPQR